MINEIENLSFLNDDPFDRLHSVKSTKKLSKAENDTIISDLPPETLKWMKLRRHMDSDQKVVISYQREKKLKEMFTSLDFNATGAIDLNELTDAINYVTEKTKNIKNFAKLDYMIDMFADMDDNGDGTVDYQEFTKGMTGTAQSLFDKASEYELEIMFNYFIEFGEIRHREFALKKIHLAKTTNNNTTNMPSNERKSSICKPNEPSNNNTKNETSDLDTYQHFKTLFGSENTIKQTEKHFKDVQKSKDLTQRKSQYLDKVLKEFIDGIELPEIKTKGNLDNENEILNKHLQYLAVQEKLKDSRFEQLHLPPADQEAIELQKKLALERRNLVSRKSRTSFMRNSIDLTTLSQAAQEASELPTLNTTTKGLQTKKELDLRLTARKDAFKILRTSMPSHELNSLLSSSNVLSSLSSPYTSDMNPFDTQSSLTKHTGLSRRSFGNSSLLQSSSSLVSISKGGVDMSQGSGTKKRQVFTRASFTGGALASLLPSHQI